MSELKVYDFAIVGSGPAGVSAAWGLIPSQKSVVMIDWANEPSKQGVDPLSYLEGSENEKTTTPKLSAPNLAYVFEDFNRQYQTRTENFAAYGSLALGGLSNAWSALTSVFSGEELKDFPVSREELLPFYRATAERIGISGSRETDLYEWLGGEHLNLQPNLKLHPFSRFLLEGYEKNKTEIHAQGFWMGRHNQAILTEALQNRRPFLQQEAKHFTHQSDAVYNAACEIPQLKRFENFSLKTGFFVDRVEKQERFFILHAKDRQNQTVSFKAGKVLLAAGALGSTRIVLKSLQKYHQKVRLLTTILRPFAVWVPPWRHKPGIFFGFSFWNLSYYLILEQLKSLRIFGHLMPTDGVPKIELMKRLPGTAPLGMAVSDYLWPSMFLGTCVFPSDFSDNMLWLGSPQEGEGLHIRGGIHPEFRPFMPQAKKVLGRAFGKMGAVFLKNSWEEIKPGSDLHYAGTLPMSSRPAPLKTNPDGQLYDLTGLYVVDGSVLSYLPGKSHTLTLMANSLRIAQKLASAV